MADDSAQANPHKSLLQVLGESGLITRQQALMVLKRHHETGESYREILAAMGVSQASIESAARISKATGPANVAAKNLQDTELVWAKEPLSGYKSGCALTSWVLLIGYALAMYSIISSTIGSTWRNANDDALANCFALSLFALPLVVFLFFAYRSRQDIQITASEAKKPLQENVATLKMVGKWGGVGVVFSYVCVCLWPYVSNLEVVKSVIALKAAQHAEEERIADAQRRAEEDRVESANKTEEQRKFDKWNRMQATSGYISPSGHIFNGVKLYHGPNKNFIGIVMGGDNSDREILILNASGGSEWKDWNMVITGNQYGKWYVRSDDPNLETGRLTSVDFTP